MWVNSTYTENYSGQKREKERKREWKNKTDKMAAVAFLKKALRVRHAFGFALLKTSSTSLLLDKIWICVGEQCDTFQAQLMLMISDLFGGILQLLPFFLMCVGLSLLFSSILLFSYLVVCSFPRQNEDAHTALVPKNKILTFCLVLPSVSLQ